ncbi:hypothetical protein V1519DRAFT_453602 [Lipomyces tetrasporus]
MMNLWPLPRLRPCHLIVVLGVQLGRACAYKETFRLGQDKARPHAIEAPCGVNANPKLELWPRHCLSKLTKSTADKLMFQH